MLLLKSTPGLRPVAILDEIRRRHPEPDFIIRLRGDGARHLILETKGYDKRAEVKAQAAKRWVSAVNAEGRHGNWQFAMVRRVGDVASAIAADASC